MDFWKHFESCDGEHFPPCVIKLLKECGYTSISAINHLQSQDIDIIENFIDENLKYIVVELKCCNSSTYQNQKRFKFYQPTEVLFLI